MEAVDDVPLDETEPAVSRKGAEVMNFKKECEIWEMLFDESSPKVDGSTDDEYTERETSFGVAKKKLRGRRLRNELSDFGVDTGESKTRRINKNREDFKSEKISDNLPNRKCGPGRGEIWQYKCTVCQKSFKFEETLNAHILIHAGANLFKCTVCLETFESRTELKEHADTHTAQKPFRCKECTKSFISSAHLERHLLMHTGEKPFECVVCHKAFAQSGNLKVHASIHTREKTHRCKVCSKVFAHRNSYVRHVRTHTGEKPYKCEVCSLEFADTSAKQRHVRKMHSDDPSVVA